MNRFFPLALLELSLPLLASASPQTGIWLKGDLHVHDDHSSDGSLPRQRNRDRAKGNNGVADQIGQAVRQGLDFLPLTDHRTYDQHYDPAWESADLLLIPGEEANGSPHSIALGAVDSIVQGAARPNSPLAHLQQSIWDAHSQGAVWSIAHPDDGEMEDDGRPNIRASVQSADLVEFWNHASDIEKEIDYAENRWNAGFRFGVAGASDSHFREYWDWQGPSLPTTHVFARAYNERGVLEGLRAGRTSLSWFAHGPFVTLAADFGRVRGMGGDEVFVKAGTRGRLRITVQRGAGTKVMLYRSPGRSAGPAFTFAPRKAAETFTVPITAGSQPEWYRVEVRENRTPDPANRRDTNLQAATSPVFISTGPVEARAETPLPPDQGRSEGARFVMGAQNAFAGFPDAAEADSALHIVAEAHDAATSRVVYRRREAGGALSPTLVLSGAGAARFPKVAAREHDVWVVWQEEATPAPHRPAIRLRHSSDRGRTWGRIQTIRAVNGRTEHPDIALAANGRAVVAWQEIQSGEPFDVMVQEIGTDAAPRNLSRPGKSIRPAGDDDTRSARYPASVWPALAVSKDGRIAVAWQDNRTDPDPLWTGSEFEAGTNPDNWQIQIALRTDRGWGAVRSLGAADRADRHPDIQFATDDTLIVVWETKELSPAGRDISLMAAVLGAGDTARVAPPVPATAMSQRPRLGLDKDGSITLVWYDSRSADWRWRVMSARYERGLWAAPTLINSPGVNSWPATAGGAIVFASTRNAARLQRDPTQQVFVLTR